MVCFALGKKKQVSQPATLFIKKQSKGKDYIMFNVNTFVESVVKFYDVEKLKRQAEEDERILKSSYKFAIQRSEQIRKRNKIIDALENHQDDLIKSVTHEVDLIRKFPDVICVENEDSCIIVKTKKLKAVEVVNGEEFEVNPLTINLDVTNNEVRITNTNGMDDGYFGYWTGHDPHPHIDGNCGELCQGNIMSSLLLSLQRQQYSVSILILLNFCKSANKDDSAGAKYIYWNNPEAIYAETKNKRWGRCDKYCSQCDCEECPFRMEEYDDEEESW